MIRQINIDITFETDKFIYTIKGEIEQIYDFNISYTTKEIKSKQDNQYTPSKQKINHQPYRLPRFAEVATNLGKQKINHQTNRLPRFAEVATNALAATAAMYMPNQTRQPVNPNTLPSFNFRHDTTSINIADTVRYSDSPPPYTRPSSYYGINTVAAGAYVNTSNQNRSNF